MTSEPLTADDWAAVGKTIRLLDILRSVDPLMPIGAALSLLHIAVHEETSVKGLEALGFSRSAASNYGKYLGVGTSRKGLPGKGLITATVDPTNRRRKSLELTDEGGRVAMELAGVLGL